MQDKKKKRRRKKKNYKGKETREKGERRSDDRS